MVYMFFSLQLSELHVALFLKLMFKRVHISTHMQ